MTLTIMSTDRPCYCPSLNTSTLSLVLLSLTMSTDLLACCQHRQREATGEHSAAYSSITHHTISYHSIAQYNINQSIIKQSTGNTTRLVCTPLLSSPLLCSAMLSSPLFVHSPSFSTSLLLHILLVPYSPSSPCSAHPSFSLSSSSSPLPLSLLLPRSGPRHPHEQETQSSPTRPEGLREPPHPTLL